MTDERRTIDPEKAEEDLSDETIRPTTLDEFVGQSRLRTNLRVFITAANYRREPLDHVLLSGPPGLGKTTLAQIVARELGVGFRATSGPVIQRAGDLAALLTNLQPRDVLFIDEIHRLAPSVEEILYPAMEDCQLDLIIGEGPGARQLFFYEPSELAQILGRGARILAFDLTEEGAAEIARRARGTPRVAMRLLRRVRDFSAVFGWTKVDAGVADTALTRLEVDVRGLDAMDRRYLRCIAENYGGGPVGVETMSAALGEERNVIEEVVEPFLIQQGFVQRTPRGRLLTEGAFRHLGLSMPASLSAQLDLLAQLPLEPEVEETS